MAIRDVDGKPYRVRTPNPLMLDQDFWDMSQVVFYNWEFETVVGEKQMTAVQTVLQPVKQVEVEKPVEPVVKPSITVFHCLPMERIKQVDELYGTETVSLRYGTQFTIEGVILDQKDFELVFWAGKEILPKSVVYPKSFEKRWWKVLEVRAEKGGYVMRAGISDLNPSFGS